MIKFQSTLHILKIQILKILRHLYTRKIHSIILNHIIHIVLFIVYSVYTIEMSPQCDFSIYSYNRIDSH